MWLSLSFPIGSGLRPKEVLSESPVLELCKVHKVDSVIEDVIDPEGAPEEGLSNILDEPRLYTRLVELGLSSIWTFPSGRDKGLSSCEKRTVNATPQVS